MLMMPYERHSYPGDDDKERYGMCQPDFDDIMASESSHSSITMASSVVPLRDVEVKKKSKSDDNSMKITDYFDKSGDDIN